MALVEGEKGGIRPVGGTGTEPSEMSDPGVGWCGPGVGALGLQHAAGFFVLCPCLYCHAQVAGSCAGQFQGARG